MFQVSLEKKNVCSALTELNKCQQVRLIDIANKSPASLLLFFKTNTKT